MPPNRSAALDRRPAGAGLRRIEVVGRPDDRDLLRRVALALAAGDAPLRAYLLAHPGLDSPASLDAAGATAGGRSPSAARKAAGVQPAGTGNAAKDARPGLGTQIAALFAGCPIEQDLPELRGELLRPLNVDD